MSPERNIRRKNNKPPISADAMADCVLYPDIMLCILTRLPLKSIHRFKSVCKPWLKLFSTPKFMKMQHAQISKDPKKQSVIIYCSYQTSYDHTMSLFKIESNRMKPTNLDRPYPKIFLDLDFVGCHNGLLCMGYPSLGHMIYLWNPATKLFKNVPLPKLDFEKSAMVSLGFGYDDEGDDFKVVRIVCSEEKNITSVRVEVYSANSDSWRTINTGFLLEN